MATKEVTVQVSKELYELGEGAADFIGAVREALKDGWQLGEDLPAIVAAAMTNLVPAVEGMDQIDDEWAQNKEATINAGLLIGSKVVGKFTS